MAKQTMDELNLPNSSGMNSSRDELVGVKNSGYLDKKGTASGENAKFNNIPEGQNIEDQPTADIREMPMRNYAGGLSYPGDGWSK